MRSADLPSSFPEAQSEGSGEGMSPFSAQDSLHPWGGGDILGEGAFSLALLGMYEHAAGTVVLE